MSTTIHNFSYNLQGLLRHKISFTFFSCVNVPDSDSCFLPSDFKPDELRQALMPTLEALYRQDPESLPFRQPVDPQLLGIPVRIRTSNKTNLVRACADTHYATTNLALLSSSLISPLPLFLLPLSLLCDVVCLCVGARETLQTCLCSVSVK